jgi:RNA polymerase sigma-70 factor (ECF subfamily)
MEEELVALLPRLRRFARALCRDDAEADDLVQAACERALTRRGRFLPGTRLDSWLYRIMQNLWLDRGRTAQARREHLDIGLVGDLPGVDGRDETEARILLAQVRERVAALPEGQRLVLALVSVEGLSYREAAERLAVPIGTVMSRLARARRRLFDLLGEAPEGASADPVALPANG